MEFVIKGLVLCLIALAGVYQADAVAGTITGGGAKAIGVTVTLQCGPTPKTSEFFKDGSATKLASAAPYTIDATAGTLVFVHSATTVGSFTCKTAVDALTLAPAVISTLTTTSTTTAGTTAGSGSGAEGINGLPLVVMIFAALVSFFLRH